MMQSESQRDSSIAVKRDMAKWLPKVNQKPVPGSAHRILTYDPATGETIWEGKPIGKNDPIPE